MPVRSLGGDRLGSGNKNKIYMHNYERSTHDLGYIFRSSMSCGTLVPCMVIPALPGDTFDIDINANIRTLPTIGPLFGSYKMQLDIFNCPIRLYHKLLHNNPLGVGNKMQNVILPQVDVKGTNLDFTKNTPLEMQQINPSSLMAYLGIRGIGQSSGVAAEVHRNFNAIGFLAYWDIYKNYYANKQEEKGVYVHTNGNNLDHWFSVVIYDGGVVKTHTWNSSIAIGEEINYDSSVYVDVTIPTNSSGGDWCPNLIWTINNGNTIGNASTIWRNVNMIRDNTDSETWRFSEPNLQIGLIDSLTFDDPFISGKSSVVLKSFPLVNCDTMRETILRENQIIIDTTYIEPYGEILKKTGTYYNLRSSQEGLAVKTYQSDIFNNWMNTAWIDGTNGISAVTAVDTSSGKFTLDTLNLSKKVYDMLNRIAISGGTYDDWIETVYTAETWGKTETPVYCGGLSKEVVFQEVVSNAATVGKPLGTLAGKGVMSDKHKGGHVIVKIGEPSYIIGIVSLTPRIDYSQGNAWDVNLKTMNDLHKPALDEIGYQELITDTMAFFDTKVDTNGICTFKSAGKQPAWLNYMTNFNKCYGNFADPRKEMYMTLNRRYVQDNANKTIKDLTTYIDPSKYNYMFAQTNLDSQNFWVQIAFDITARRKMSAKVMPNL